MSDEPCTVVRNFRPNDREAAIQVLAASFQGFGPVDQVVGDDDKAQDRCRSMFGMTFNDDTKQNCIPSARDSVAADRSLRRDV